MEWWRCPKVDVTFSQEREAEGCTAIANREERLCVGLCVWMRVDVSVAVCLCVCVHGCICVRLSG